MTKLVDPLRHVGSFYMLFLVYVHLLVIWLRLQVQESIKRSDWRPLSDAETVVIVWRSKRFNTESSGWDKN